MPGADVLSPAGRAALVERWSRPFAGRPVVVGPVVLAGVPRLVEALARLGCPVLVLSTARGAGPAPDPDHCVVVDVDVPATPSVTEELRLLDRVARTLPPATAAAIEAFDPGRRGVWWGSPFLSSDEPVLGRPVVAGRPRAFLDLEDKLLAERVWQAADVRRAPHRVVDVADHAGQGAATAELAGPLGVVWSGDARDGFNGGGEFVRWVRDERDATAATAFFSLHCDRVRVAPFLDGVPCSIHGLVLPDGTAALRPVEIATLRSPGRRSLVQAGLGTSWDPPAADRDDMRDAVRRVGEHLRTAHGYRGAFGIDGVLTADGFRPTELNTRMSAGLTLLGQLDPPFFSMLQTALLDGRDTDLTVADVESLVPLLDAERRGRVSMFGTGPATPTTLALDWDGRAFTVTADQRAPHDAADVLEVGVTPSGWFAKVDPCSALSRPGGRLAPVNAALVDLLDRLLGTELGPLEAAPDVRRSVTEARH